MDRRAFLTWMGLGWLASVSPIVISAAIAQSRRQRPSNSRSDRLEGVVFYVAPSGNDAWSGTRRTANSAKTDGPFATLERSRQAIRELKSQQSSSIQQPITVLLRGGTYYLSEPLVFSPEDSGTAEYPITYRAYPNEKPIISGGRRITNWQQQGKLWVANLPEVKSGKWYFRLLRSGDEWAIRARYPNFDPQQPLKGGWLFVKQEGDFKHNVARIHNVGDRLEWSINVPKATKYRVWVRYAHNMKAFGVEAMDERTAIRVSDRPPTPLRNLPNTGSFDNFRWTWTTTIDLPAGKQTLIWENLKGGGLALDAFCLTDDPDWNPENDIRLFKEGSENQIQPPQKGKNIIVIQAETFNKAVAPEVTILPQSRVSDAIVIAPAKFPKWKNWEGAEINAFMKSNYGNAIFPISSVETKKFTVSGRFSNTNFPIAVGNRFFIDNVREALDSPNEWYLEPKTGELIYWAVSPNPNNVEVVAPTIDKLIVLQGNRQNKSFVENIHFRGLTFTDTDYTLAESYYFPADAAIWLSTARQCVIRNCSFVRLGGYAIRLDHHSHQNRIINNKMQQLGQGGVILRAKDTDSQPINNLIAANEIHDCGYVYKHVAGVYLTTGSDNRITNNHIYRMPRYGISLKSLDSNNYSHNNIIEFNQIEDTNLETSDTGAIETLGRDRQSSGNIIRYNLIRNVVGMGTTINGEIISPYYTWGIYLDDYSSGTTIYGNIIVGTVLGAIFIHGGKDNTVENNIFIDGAESQIRLQPRDNVNFMTGNIIRRNIIYYKNQNATLWSSNANTWQRNFVAQADFNLYWQNNLDLEQTQKSLFPEGNFTTWQVSGFDRNSLIADPLFIAPNQGNYNLKSNSPAFRLGFESIPVDKIGLKGFNRIG